SGWIVREGPDGLRVRTSTTRVSAGTLLVVLGVAFGLVLLVLAAALAAAALGAAAAFWFVWLTGIGALLLWTGRPVLLDRRRRRLRLRRGRTIAFDDIAACVLVFRPLTIRYSPVDHYDLRLLLRDGGEVVRRLERLRSFVAGRVGGRLFSSLEERDRFHVAVERLRGPCAGASPRLASSADPPRIRMAAVCIAAELDVPLLDDTGDEPCFDVPETLALPLPRRLALHQAASRDPGSEPEEEVSVEEGPGRLVLGWGGPLRRAPVCILLLVLAGLLAFLVWEGHATASIAVFVVLGLVLTLVASLYGGGRQTMEIDGERIRHQASFPWRRVTEGSLADLDLVQVAARQQRTGLRLLGRFPLIACPMSVEQARWMRNRVEAFLARTAGR
ncbi:MAG: hypothetical protein ACE5JG_12000, partial [Planctomycetota bacterium]